MMRLSEWNSCIAYANTLCAEHDNITWRPYNLYDSAKGIKLLLLDSNGSVYKQMYSGRTESFEEMKQALGRCMVRLTEIM